jgi:hypothetical protein
LLCSELSGHLKVDEIGDKIKVIEDVIADVEVSEKTKWLLDLQTPIQRCSIYFSAQWRRTVFCPHLGRVLCSRSEALEE